MITIALDEYGRFEFSKGDMRNNGVFLIGGVLFKGKGKNSYEAELTRLQEFFMKGCRRVGASYPTDLHREQSGYVDNMDAVLRVKAELERQLPEFLTGTGCWEKKKPDGCYYLYAMVSDKKGIEELTALGLSNLIDDNVGTNRYEHMAYRTVENLLFFNPVIRDDDMNLDLATRSLPINDSARRKEELATLGYDRNSYYFHITDTSGYRAALATAIQDSTRKNIRFRMSVRSMSYRESNENFSQGFLYLADTVCSVFQYAVDGSRTVPEAMQRLLDAGTKTLGPGHTLLYSYSKVDEEYRRAYRATESGDYYGALKTMKQAELGNVPGNELYRKIWFNALEKSLVENGSAQGLQTALEKLDAWLGEASYSLKNAKYIHDVLSRLADRLPANRLDAPLLFRFYCTAIRIANHMGDYNAALAAYEKCVPMAKYVTIEDYLELRNLYTVALQDSCRNEEALASATDTVAYEEMLVDIRKDILPDNDNVFVHYGRSLSQKAQALSFLGRYDEAAETFEKALAAFGDDKKEREFTMSLYLHALIEKGDRAAYAKYAEEYFGSRDRNKQLDYICGSPKNRSPRFMLYVYTKAMVLLYGDSLKGQNVKDLLDRIEQYYMTQRDAHPWEMIFKYCAFIELLANGGRYTPRCGELMKKARSVIADSKDGILLQIAEENDRQFDALCDTEPLKQVYAASPLNYMYR